MKVDLFAKIIKESRSAEFKNAIVFSVDNNYLPYAVFVANQIINLEPNLDLDICICLPDLSIVPESFIASNIRFIEIEVNGLEALPVGRLSLSAYHRLFLPEILADDYQYLIYLDADIYVLQPFSKDIFTVIEGFNESFAVAAAPDISELQLKVVKDSKLKKIEGYIKHYHEYNHIYRNSGVLVFNVKNYLNQEIRDKVLDYAFDNIAKLQCHDQSALNGALKTDIALLPFRFNWQTHKLTINLIDEYQPYILHFIGENKPWRLKNYLTEKYTNDYVCFFENYYTDTKINILTDYEWRLRSPKYSNKLKELISREAKKMKKDILHKNNGLKTKQYNKIKELLNQDFI
ncbi:glycosyltransferase family 8 protein [Psychrobacter pygoscelis]|uniref:glycosyltransferase family 8 protein n=1 Tax=Psychrobacter pygoscelis TaxID=2488563 RepID=UPI00103E4A29|nr:glycosyltransferase [Psychrobacter pygoscelis]